MGADSNGLGVEVGFFGRLLSLAIPIVEDGSWQTKGPASPEGRQVGF
jgi:hypothetical protein